MHSVEAFMEKFTHESGSGYAEDIALDIASEQWDNVWSAYDLLTSDYDDFLMQRRQAKRAETSEMKLEEWGAKIGTGLFLLGLLLVAIGSAGTLAPVATWGGYALTASVIVGGATAALNFLRHASEGTLDAKTALIDIAQIVGALARVRATSLGRIVAPGSVLIQGAGTLERATELAGRFYLLLETTNLAGDVVQIVTMTQDLAKHLDEIESMPGNSEGDRSAKDKAKLLLILQYIINEGLTILSVKGNLSALRKNAPLMAHRFGEHFLVTESAAAEILHSSAAKPYRTKFMKSRFKLSPEETVEYLSANVQGLTKEQAEFIVHNFIRGKGSFQTVSGEGAPLTFGGSRVAGRARLDNPEDFSDLDLGYDRKEITRSQFQLFMKEFNNKFAGTDKGPKRIIRSDQGFPDFESIDRNIDKILSPEEQFMRTGIRQGSGEVVEPSGYIKVFPDGTIERGIPKTEGK